VTKSASYGAPISFQVGERVGLLVAAPQGDAEPVAIEIAPLPLAICILGRRSYVPEWSGVSRDRRVPIVLRHPDASPDYPAYLATLEFDLDAGTARWNARALAEGRGHTSTRCSAAG
jgi:hypothetical protein